MHPNGRDYSCFSPVHNSYTRIDMIVVQHCHLDKVKMAEIGTIAISNHVSVFMDMDILGIPRTTFQWRLNDTLLQELEVVKHIKRELSTYFSINAGGGNKCLSDVGSK